MPADTKKRPAMKPEPGEGKAHEMQESPEEEVREGSESEEGHYSKTNRKRSAKGAKKTKAPMDGEGCGCGGKKGATCDGNCGSSMKKRSDALTPQEYLAACDLGIQGMPRPYIQARLDTAQRLDLKCGKGSVSKGEKCRKGPATTAEKLMIGGGLVGAAASTVGMFRAKNKMAYERASTGFHGSTALAVAGLTAMNERKGNKAAARAGQILTAGQLALAGASGFEAERMRKERNHMIRETLPKIKQAKAKANDQLVASLKAAKRATNPDNIPDVLKTQSGVESIYTNAAQSVERARNSRSEARSAIRSSIQGLKEVAPLSAARRRRRERNGENMWAMGFGI